MINQECNRSTPSLYDSDGSLDIDRTGNNSIFHSDIRNGTRENEYQRPPYYENQSLGKSELWYTQKKQENTKMSFVCALCNQNGIVMAGDSLPSRAIGTEAVWDKLRNTIPKVFQSEQFILGTCGLNEVWIQQEDCPLEDIIHQQLEGFTGTYDKFMEKLTNILSRSLLLKNLSEKGYEFLVGARDATSPYPYKILRYLITASGLSLTYLSYGAAMQQMGVSATIPYLSEIRDDTPLERLHLAAKQIVENVIDSGRAYKEKGLIQYYPVGGDIRVVTFQ